MLVETFIGSSYDRGKGQEVSGITYWGFIRLQHSHSPSFKKSAELPSRESIAVRKTAKLPSLRVE